MATLLARTLTADTLRVLAAIVGAAALVLAVSAGAQADLKLPRPTRDAPMRIMRVMSSDPACGSECPEWISAEGLIAPGAAKAFEQVAASLNGQRLPVILSSHGGSVPDALRMGVLIRERGLVVAVARTVLARCEGRGEQCPPRGQVVVGGAFCASACPLILAGGIERLVGPNPMVGVHQITTIMKEVEGSEHLTTIKKAYEQGLPDQLVARYWAAMGVGEPVMGLLRKTPAGDIRWLSLGELRESRLATDALDFNQPMLTQGVNGLNAHAFDDPAKADVLTASESTDGAVAVFAYRRGGGVVEFALRGPVAGLDRRRAIANAGDPIALTSKAPGDLAADLPIARFCGLAREGKVVVLSGGGADAEPATFVFANMEGSRRIIEEVCP